MEISTIFRQLKKEINLRVHYYLNYYKNNFKNKGMVAEDAFVKLQTFSQGGKGIRGSLFVLSAEMFGYKDKRIFDIAATLEILQAALLIHDDIMDNDLLRRGNPSIFAQYITLGEKIKAQEATSYGKSMGICLGDIGFFIALDICQKALQQSEMLHDVMSTLYKELITVTLGQMDDVTFAAGEQIPSEKEILRMYQYKTAHYTFSLPFCLAAIMSKQSQKTVHQMEQLGEYIGILFQIADDAIGLFQSANISGKPFASDLRENKKTYIRTLIHNKATADENLTITKLHNKSEISSKDLAFFSDMIEKYNIKSEINNITEFYKKEAVIIIGQLPSNSTKKTFLLHLIDYVTKRVS